MIAKTPWISRAFNFDFPVGHFPFIYSRLQGTSVRIEDLIRDFSEEQLEYKPDGKWSAKEHIGHLIDLEELHEARLDDYKNKAAMLRAADMTNKKTNEANHNARPVSKLLNDFRKSRVQFLKRLDALNESQLSQSSIHPRLKKEMRTVDMAYFVAEHDDHHVVCIREVLEKKLK